MLPKGMQVKEFCDNCHKEMTINRSFLREDESAVEVWYECSCGHTMGYAYFNGFIEAYKQQKNYPGEPSVELPTLTDDEFAELHEKEEKE